MIGAGIFSGIYFVSQFSAVYPPIKQYDFSTNVNDLEKIIIDLVEKEPDFNYSKKDTVGNLENGFAYYMEIEIKNSDCDIIYLIKYCDSKYSNNNKQHSELKLIHTFDRPNNIGGYKIKENGVKGLLEIFDKEILVKTKREIIKTSP